MKILTALIFIVALTSCSTKDNAHTTVTIPIDPPPHQVLTVVNNPVPRPTTADKIDSSADLTKPYLVFHLEDKKTFRVGESVPIDFTVVNAKLKAEGGDFRVRYITDDDEMQWLDKSDSFWLMGWTTGNHTVRIELIGPDGWPYKNGNANIVTREIKIQ
ncbi:MAG TPA: hypothetical protein VI306_14960 [Pyrinomonadaceae bacterium]